MTLSYPGPGNPYGPPPQGQSPYDQQPYGQGQHAQYGTTPYGGQPGYGYPPPGFPGGPMPYARMPGLVIAARVLLFVAGTMWALLGLLLLWAAAISGDLEDEDIPGFSDLETAAVGAFVLLALAGVGLAAAHIIPAALFGRGRTPTRVVAILAASFNTLFGLLAFLGTLSNGTNPVLGMLWLATGILTIIFCAVPQAGQWFNRPRI